MCIEIFISQGCGTCELVPLWGWPVSVCMVCVVVSYVNTIMLCVCVMVCSCDTVGGVYKGLYPIFYIWGHMTSE